MRKNMLRAALTGGITYVDGLTGTDGGGNYTLELTSLTFETGDLGLLFIGHGDNTQDDAITGWTSREQYFGFGASGQVFTRELVASDTTFAATSSADSTTWILAIFRGASESANALDYDSKYEDTATPQSPAMARSQDATVVFLNYDSNTITISDSPSGYTVLGPVDIVSSDQTAAGAYLLEEGDATPDWWNLSGAGDCVSFTVALHAA